MPSLEWNKETWARQLQEYKDANIPYDGSQWGTLNPCEVFPPLLRRVVPESVAARLLRNPPIWRILHRVFRPRVPFYPELYAMIHRYILPYINSQAVVLEIGPGGGRFTRYMWGAKEIVLVDIVPDFFEYLRQRFPRHASKMRFYESKSYELTGIETGSVDFVFTFDTFVHIEPEGIREYLQHIDRVLKPGGVAVVHYGDITKQAATEEGRFFASMDSHKMESFVAALPDLSIVEHDKTFLLHSNLIVLRKK